MRKGEKMKKDEIGGLILGIIFILISIYFVIFVSINLSKILDELKYNIGEQLKETRWNTEHIETMYTIEYNKRNPIPKNKHYCSDFTIEMERGNIIYKTNKNIYLYNPGKYVFSTELKFCPFCGINLHE